MRHALAALAGLVSLGLGGCGAGPEDVAESDAADVEAGEMALAETASAGATACPLMERIIAARADGFASLDPETDVIPGAAQCEVLPGAQLIGTWTMVGGARDVPIATYSCTLYEGTDVAEAQRVWDEATSAYARSCFEGDWQFGAGGGRAMSSDTQVRWTSYWREGLDPAQDAEGVNHVALSFGWWDMEGGPDQRIFFHATASTN